MDANEPPAKRARVDGIAADGAAAVAAVAMDDAPAAAAAAAAVAEESMRRMLEKDASDGSRSTLHFTAATAGAGGHSGVTDCLDLLDSGAAMDLSSELLTPYPVASDWDYRGARVLAPMVRIGTLPMRLLAAQMGATMCYSEELVALKLRNCVRQERADGQGRTFVDFVPTSPAAIAAAKAAAAAAAAAPNSAFVGASSAAAAPARPAHNASIKSLPMLTTLPGERLVVQLGAANAAEALAAAQIVAGDTRAIDLNMGCLDMHMRACGRVGRRVHEFNSVSHNCFCVL